MHNERNSSHVSKVLISTSGSTSEAASNVEVETDLGWLLLKWCASSTFTRGSVAGEMVSLAIICRTANNTTVLRLHLQCLIYVVGLTLIGQSTHRRENPDIPHASMNNRK